MSSIMQYNGSAVIAMAGKNCVAIASDRRYGIRNQTMGCEMQKTFKMNDRTWVGLTGLATDVQTLAQKFNFRVNMYRLREDRDISPSAFSNMVSSLLYEKRFGPYFCEPVIAGLGEGEKVIVGPFSVLRELKHDQDVVDRAEVPDDEKLKGVVVANIAPGGLIAPPP